MPDDFQAQPPPPPPLGPPSYDRYTEVNLRKPETSGRGRWILVLIALSVILVGILAAILLTDYAPTGPAPLTKPVLPASKRAASLNQEQQNVVGTWQIVKPSDRGAVQRKLVFHADGVRFTTSCRSTFDDAVVNGQGEGTWTVNNGVIRVKWIERQVGATVTQEVPYDLDLRIDESDGEMQLVVPENSDRYRRAR